MPIDLGVFVGNRADELPPFESFVGTQVGAVLAFTGNEGDWGDADPSWQLDRQWLGGTGRRIRWTIPMVPDRYGVEGYRAGAAGHHNARWQDWANKCLKHRSGDNDPIFVRTSWELGGEWYAWTGIAKQDAAAHIKCQQQFFNVFKKTSPRFRTVFDYVPDRGPQEHLYPGDEFVDVIGQDTYWHTQYQGAEVNAAWNIKLTLDRGLTYTAWFARQHGKQLAIPEFGVPGGGHDGSTYIRHMRSWCEANGVVFLDYWNSKAAYDGLLHDGHPVASAAELKKWYQENKQGTPQPDPLTPPAPPPTTPPTTDNSLTGRQAQASFLRKVATVIETGKVTIP